MDDQPASLEELRRQVKRQLRRRMTSLRKALPESAIAARSAAIVERLARLDAVVAARSVALFWPMAEKHEVDLRALDRLLADQGKARYYPFMDRLPEGGYRTGFRLVNDPSELVLHEQRFHEPPLTAPAAGPTDIDVIVVPALALTHAGARLGYGAGFYDATIPDFRPPALAVAIAFDFQLLVELPTDAHDVSCDMIVTDHRTLVAG